MTWEDEDWPMTPEEKERAANPPPEIGEGFWIHADNPEMKDPDVYKVVLSNSGYPYAKKLDQETGDWEYVRGGMAILRKDYTEPLSLEKAKELGQLYGICQRCGATLTNEESIANGIGPICAGKF